MERIENKVIIELERVEALKKAWENVEFVTKKDRKPFENLTHDIKNAQLECTFSGISGITNILRVYTWTIRKNYVDDYIRCYHYINYFESEKAKIKPQNIVKFDRDVYYVFDIEDIKEKVKDRIIQLENEIDNLKKQLCNLEVAYTNFKDGYLKLLEGLKKDTFSTSECGNFAYKEILNYVTEYYF